MAHHIGMNEAQEQHIETPYLFPWRRRIVVGFITLAVLFLAVYLALPYGIQYSLQRWLKNEGAAYVDIEYIHINPFKGNIELSNLRVGKSDKAFSTIGNAYLSFQWLPLFRQHFVLNNIDITNANLDILQKPDGTIYIGPLAVTSTEAAKTGQDTKAAITSLLTSISNSKIHFKSDNFDLNIDIKKLDGGNISTMNVTDATPINVIGRINHAEFKFNGKLKPLANNFSLAGRLQINDLSINDYASAFLPVNVSLNGKLTSTLETSLVVNASHAEQSADKQLHMQYTIKGDFDLNDINLQDGNQTIQDWQTSRISLKAVNIESTDANQTLVRISNASLHGIKVRKSSRSETDNSTNQLILTADEANLSDIQLMPVNQLSVKSLNFQNVVLGNPGNALQYLQSTTLGISGLSANTQQLNIKDMNSENLKLLQDFSTVQVGVAPAPAVIQAGHSTLQDLQIGPQARTSVKHINIQKAVCNFHRLKDGRWQTLNKLPENKTPQTTRDSQPAFRIDSLVIDGQSIINLRDEKISPALNTRIKLNKARVSDINSQAPKRPVKLALSGQLGEYSSFDLTGNLFPFTDKTNLNIQGKIVNLDLPPYSGYAAEHLGYQLSSGHLDSNIETQIKDDVINGNIKLKLNNLDISEDDPQKMKALTEQISIPLDTALAMLRNDNNDIKLDVAVTGNITDPSFDFGDAINQAIGKAVKKTAISYLR